MAPSEGPTPEQVSGEVRAKAKVCLVGANQGCKTNLVRAHVVESFDNTQAMTLGTNVSVKHLRLPDVPGFPSLGLDLLLWDIESRQEGRRELLDAYAYGSSGILAVMDMTRRATLQEADEWIAGVEDVAGRIPVVVIGANCDLKGGQVVSEEEVRRLADSYGAACFFASANSKDPVEEAFMVLAERIASRRFRRERGP